MNCTLTGAVVFIRSHRSSFIADLFEQDGIMVFRIAGRIPMDSFERHPVTHDVVKEMAFFDKDVMSENQNATLIVKSENVTVTPAQEPHQWQE